MDSSRGGGRGVLVFDGDCGFCTTSARFAKRWVDRRGRYDLRPWQELDLASLGLTEAQCIEAAQYVRPDGSVASAHLAIAEGLRNGAPLWRPLGLLVAAPGVRAVAGRVYTWVADHRYQLPGGTPACAPTVGAPAGAAATATASPVTAPPAATPRAAGSSQTAPPAQ